MLKIIKEILLYPYYGYRRYRSRKFLSKIITLTHLERLNKELEDSTKKLKESWKAEHEQ